MKKMVARFAVALDSLLVTMQTVLAQGATFTYQGQRQNNGRPAHGNNDFTFAWFNHIRSHAAQAGGALTHWPVGAIKQSLGADLRAHDT
jgi:hypothetical protein